MLDERVSWYMSLIVSLGESLAASSYQWHALGEYVASARVALQVTGRAAPYVEPPSDALGELLGAISCWEIYSTT